MHGAENGESGGCLIATDMQENVFSVGVTYLNGHFGPDSFSTISNRANISLVKYDSVGNLGWTLNASRTLPMGLATDMFGHEYLLAQYNRAELRFGGMTLVNPNADSNCYFLAKIDAFGNVDWIKNIGNAKLGIYIVENIGNCVATDDCGNVYISCSVGNNLTVGAFSDSSSGPLRDDILLAKYDSSGNLLWAKGFPGNGADIPTGIAVSRSGNIYLGGMFTGDSLTFGGIVLSDTLRTSSNWNSFITKLDNAGNPIWSNISYNAIECENTTLALDAHENVYISGYFSSGYGLDSSIHFGAVTLASTNHQGYGFLVKYDEAGTALWGKTIQGKGVLQNSLTIDPCNNIWVEGINFMYSDSVIFDTIDGNVFAVAGRNSEPIFLANFSSSGTFLAYSALPGTTNVGDNAIMCDRAGNIYLTAEAQMDTFILAGDSLYNTPPPTRLGETDNMFVAKYSTGRACTYAPLAVSLCTLSVSEIVVNNEVTVYPNPANSTIIVTSPFKIENVKICNILGQVVLAEHFDTNTVELDISDLSAGLYLIKVNGNEVRKLVKE